MSVNTNSNSNTNDNNSKKTLPPYGGVSKGWDNRVGDFIYSLDSNKDIKKKLNEEFPTLSNPPTNTNSNL